jgi:hypothetical protein
VVKVMLTSKLKHADKIESGEGSDGDRKGDNGQSETISTQLVLCNCGWIRSRARNRRSEFGEKCDREEKVGATGKKEKETVEQHKRAGWVE